MPEERGLAYTSISMTSKLQRTRAEQEGVTSVRFPSINTSPAPKQSAPASAEESAEQSQPHGNYCLTGMRKRAA